MLLGMYTDADTTKATRSATKGGYATRDSSLGGTQVQHEDRNREVQTQLVAE